MVKLFRAELTPTGRPVLLHGEVERGMLDKVRAARSPAGGSGALDRGSDTGAVPCPHLPAAPAAADGCRST